MDQSIINLFANLPLWVRRRINYYNIGSLGLLINEWGESVMEVALDELVCDRFNTSDDFADHALLEFSGYFFRNYFTDEEILDDERNFNEAEIKLERIFYNLFFEKLKNYFRENCTDNF